MLKSKLVRQLEFYKKEAPFYNSTIGFIEEFKVPEDDSLAVLVTKALMHTLDALDIAKPIEVQSALNLDSGIDSTSRPVGPEDISRT